MKWFLLKIHVYEIPKITVAFLKQANTKGKIPEPEGIVLGMMRSKPDETFPYKCRDLYITYFSCLWLDLKFVRKILPILPIKEYTVYPVTVFYSKTLICTLSRSLAAFSFSLPGSIALNRSPHLRLFLIDACFPSWTFR